MARDIYYQPVDNPLRTELLPKRRPMTILPVHTDRIIRHAVHGKLMRYGSAVLLALLAIAWLAPLIGGAVVLSAYYIYFGRQAIEKRDPRWLTLTCPFPAAVAVAVVGCAIPALLYFVASAMLGWLCWSYGCHWTAYCTVSPFPREAGNVLRRHWARHILVSSILLPIAGMAAALTTQPAIFFLSVAAAVTTQLVMTIRSRNGFRIFSVATRAVACWLTYNPNEKRYPGLLLSPAGPWRLRASMTGASLVLTGVALLGHWSPVEPAPESIVVPAYLTATTPIDTLPLTMVAVLLSVIATTALPVAMTLSVMADATRRIPGRISGRAWSDLVYDIQHSHDPVERRAIYRGRNATDGSPVLVPCKIFAEHAHFLGDTGGGKTSLGLMPTYEQLLARGDCTVIVIDLKADTLEHLATLEAAAGVARRRHGVTIPVKQFTNQTGLGTYCLNPLTQPFWRDFELYMRTDILCGALGLTYGTDYGQGYYSSANAAVLYHTLKKYPEAATFRELADAIGYVVANAKKHELHSEIKKAGVHVQEVIKRLAASMSLNVASPVDDFPYSINLANVFSRPQALYFHLSSSLAPGSSPEIARLVVYLLLCAADRVERRHPVYLVIDEFQRMVASNVEYMLQLARSMGVGIILANQSLQDLKRSTTNLIPAVEANCRYREWSSVSSSDDRKNLVESSGETIDMFRSVTTTTGDHSSTSVSRQERLVPRLTTNDILLATDHPMKSVLKITRGDGYAQYGGMPFIVEHDYHITAEEYERRKAFSWPEPEPGMLVAGSQDPDGGDSPPTDPPSEPSPPPSPGPIVTTEVVGNKPPVDKDGVSDLFAKFQDDQSRDKTAHPNKRRRKRSRRSGDSDDTKTTDQRPQKKKPD